MMVCPRKMGPLPKDHPSIGEICYACKKPLQENDYVTIIPLGPGDNPTAQQKARNGQAYNAIGIVIHWSCATGI